MHTSWAYKVLGKAGGCLEEQRVLLQAYELMQQQIPTAMQWLQIKADDFIAANNLSAVSSLALLYLICSIQARKQCQSL